MKAEVVGRQHPQHVPWPAGCPVRQGAENLCVMGQTPMLLASSAAISQPPGLKRRRSAFYTRTARATGLAGPAGRARTKNRDFFLGYKNSPRLGGALGYSVRWRRLSFLPRGRSSRIRHAITSAAAAAAQAQLQQQRKRSAPHCRSLLLGGDMRLAHCSSKPVNGYRTARGGVSKRAANGHLRTRWRSAGCPVGGYAGTGGGGADTDRLA